MRKQEKIIINNEKEMLKETKVSFLICNKINYVLYYTCSVRNARI